MISRLQFWKACLVLTLCFLLSLTLAQTAEQIDAIGTALQNHEYDKALTLLRPALQRSPNDSRLWAMQGTAYAKKDDKPHALASFRHALQLSPDYVPALQGAAQIEFESGSPAAIPLLQRLLRLQPQNLTTHGMLAVLEYQQGKCNLAIPHFEKAEAVFGAQVDALNAYATCLVRLKQFDRAIS